MLMRVSITELTEKDCGAHALVGSHGGAPTGCRAVRCRVASLICHDAGVGRNEAGIAALAILERYGVPGAAVSHQSAYIGNPQDMFNRGFLSRVNGPASVAGLTAGMSVREASVVIEGSGFGRPGVTVRDHTVSEFRRQQIDVGTATGSVQIVVVDSASSITARDDGAIVVTGSHGGLLGGAAERVLKARPFFVAFNDAGIGLDGAGTNRLPMLDILGVAAVCVSAESARIGDGMSTYQTGIISIANDTAHALGAQMGLGLTDFISKLAGGPSLHRISATLRTSIT